MGRVPPGFNFAQARALPVCRASESRQASSPPAHLTTPTSRASTSRAPTHSGVLLSPNAPTPEPPLGSTAVAPPEPKKAKGGEAKRRRSSGEVQFSNALISGGSLSVGEPHNGQRQLRLPFTSIENTPPPAAPPSDRKGKASTAPHLRQRHFAALAAQEASSNENTPPVVIDLTNSPTNTPPLGLSPADRAADAAVHANHTPLVLTQAEREADATARAALAGVEIKTEPAELPLTATPPAATPPRHRRRPLTSHHHTQHSTHNLPGFSPVQGANFGEGTSHQTPTATLQPASPSPRTWLNAGPSPRWARSSNAQVFWHVDGHLDFCLCNARMCLSMHRSPRAYLLSHHLQGGSSSTPQIDVQERELAAHRAEDPAGWETQEEISPGGSTSYIGYGPTLDAAAVTELHRRWGSNWEWA